MEDREEEAPRKRSRLQPRDLSDDEEETQLEDEDEESGELFAGLDTLSDEAAPTDLAGWPFSFLFSSFLLWTLTSFSCSSALLLSTTSVLLLFFFPFFFISFHFFFFRFVFISCCFLAFTNLDLSRLAAKRGEESVKLLKTLTKLLVSPREATKSVRQNLGKQLRLKMTKNLYLTSAEIDEIICTETKTEVALPSLSEWVSSFVCFFLILFIFVGLLISAFASFFFFFWQALGLVRKIRGKYSAFCREYFESALEVPHVSKVTPFESITGIVKQRAEKDQGWFVCLFSFFHSTSTHCVPCCRLVPSTTDSPGEKSHCVCFQEDLQSAWQHLFDGPRRDHCELFFLSSFSLRLPLRL